MSEAFFDMAPLGAFEPRPGGGMRLHGGKGSSAPPPDPRLVEAQLKSMGYQDKFVQQMMDNSDWLRPYQQRQIEQGIELQDRLAPIQEEQLRFGLKTANTAYEQSQEDRAWALQKRGQLDSAQGALLDEAATYDEGQRRDDIFGKAVGDITQSFDQVEAQGLRTMARMGANPSDAKMGAMVNQTNLQEALAKSQAGSKSSEMARAEGLQLKSNAANMLSGYPSMGMQASSQGAGFGGMGLTIANNGLAGAGNAMNFMGAGLQGMNAGYGQAGQMAGQMGSNATNMWGAQANYKNSQDQIAASSDPFAALLGAGAQLGSAGIGKYSDRRLKTDIELVGRNQRTGLNLYAFRYIDGDGKRYIGVMADEVRNRYPEAVLVMDGGFLAVDYAMLGLEMVEAPGENA